MKYATKYILVPAGEYGVKQTNPNISLPGKDEAKTMEYKALISNLQKIGEDDNVIQKDGEHAYRLRKILEQENKRSSAAAREPFAPLEKLLRALVDSKDSKHKASTQSLIPVWNRNLSTAPRRKTASDRSLSPTPRKQTASNRSPSPVVKKKRAEKSDTTFSIKPAVDAKKRKSREEVRSPRKSSTRLRHSPPSRLSHRWQKIAK